LKYLLSIGAKCGPSGPRAPLPEDEMFKAQSEEWARALNESEVSRVCRLDLGNLIRGSSGKFYLVVYNIFYILGNTKEEVGKYFTDQADLYNVPWLDPYKLSHPT